MFLPHFLARVNFAGVMRRANAINLKPLPCFINFASGVGALSRRAARLCPQPRRVRA
jgi:hypothetical protein